MTIRFSKRFKKQYQKLSPKLQNQTKSRLELWQEDPTNSLLRLYRLEGRLSRYYSINITGDMRALYEGIGDDVYLYDLVGSLSQLYG